MNFIIAVMSLALVIAPNSKSDDSDEKKMPVPDGMEAIRAAWKKREQDTPAVQASFDYHSLDLNGKRLRRAEVELTVFRDQLKANCGYSSQPGKQFDESSEDAVRNVWKFTKIEGWQAKILTDSEWQVRNPTNGTGLMSLQFFPLVYRGLHDEMTGTPFQAWQIDKELLGPDDDPRLIPISQKQNTHMVVMLLDPNRDFVPVVSRVGNLEFRLPGSSNFTEVRVDWKNDVALPVPKRWAIYHVPKGVRKARTPVAECSISHFNILHEEIPTDQSAEPK